MKWMLIAIVLGAHQVETDLLYDSWVLCKRASYEATEARTLGAADMMTLMLTNSRAAGQELSEDAGRAMVGRAMVEADAEVKFLCIPHN